jgi:predicted MFS family arabinose efflux permease
MGAAECPPAEPTPISDFIRDRRTWTLYGQLSAFAYFLYGFGPSVPLLGHDLALPDGVAALHGTTFAAGAIVAGLSNTSLARLLGRTRLQQVALLFLVAGACVYCVGRSLPTTLTGAFVAGYGGNVVVNMTAASLADHHGDNATKAISEANGISVGVGVLAPFSLGLAALLGLGWRVGLLVVVPFTLGVLLWSRQVRLVTVDRRSAPREPSTRCGRLPCGFGTAWWLFFLCTVVELCMTFWASQHLFEFNGLSRSAATMTVTLMLAGMAGGRLAGAHWTGIVSDDTLLVGSLVLNLAGFVLFWSVRQPLVAGIGIVLCGLGMAMQFPLTVSRAIARSGGRPDQAMAWIALGEGAAAALGPLVLGSLAERTGIHLAFLLVPALLLSAALIFLLQNKPFSPDHNGPSGRGHHCRLRVVHVEPRHVHYARDPLACEGPGCPPDYPSGRTRRPLRCQYRNHLDLVREITWVADLARTWHGRKPLAVASNSTAGTIAETMTHVGLAGLFRTVVSLDDVSAGKPAPDIFLLAAERLGVPATRCLVLEDSDVGVEAADRAGAAVVDVRTVHLLRAA